MQLTIESSDFPVTDAIEKFVRKEIKKSMAICDANINRLVVRLKSNSNSRPFPEPQCCVEVHIPNQTPVIVTKRNANTYSTIRAAVSRAGRVTLRKIRKNRDVKLNQR